MSDKLKILICGDVKGQLNTFISRVTNVNKKSGPFEFVFCVGDFFGASDEEWVPYKTGKITVPLPIYILGPNKSDHVIYYPDVSGSELAPNITYLGKRGLFSTSSGLKVAYVSGVEDNSQPAQCKIIKEDIDRVRNACIKDNKASYKGVDLLLTSSWPAGVSKYDQTEVTDPSHKSVLISQLAVAIKPRYHFCSSRSKYYERIPYKNLGKGDSVYHITRVIALAEVGNTNKEKWIYALSISPVQVMKQSELSMMTTDTTECPYTSLSKDSTPQQFFYDMTSTNDGTRKRKGRDQNKSSSKHKKEIKMTISQDDCWFCMASSDFEKHLVVSIGEEVYVTLAKGPLVHDHVIIAPIAHYGSYLEITDTAIDEIKKYKLSLKKLYNSQNKEPVFFERNFKAPHFQLQAVPVPLGCVKHLKKLFMDLSASKGYPLVELPDNMQLLDVINNSSSYFYIEVENTRLLHIIKKPFFPLQLGREMMAHEKLLNASHKIDWKKCEVSKEEEMELVNKFRSNLRKFHN